MQTQMDPVGIIKPNYLHIQILTHNINPLTHVSVVDYHLQAATHLSNLMSYDTICSVKILNIFIYRCFVKIYRYKMKRDMVYII
jgi:hypothetical protein